MQKALFNLHTAFGCEGERYPTGRYSLGKPVADFNTCDFCRIVDLGKVVQFA
jgi:hypothetical protein